MTGMETLLQGFGTSLDAVGRMALLVLAGFLMIRKRWIGPGTLSDLTRLLIDAVIPCAFVLAMVRSFSIPLLGQGMLLAAVSAGWILLSWGLGTGFYRLFPGDSPARDRAVTAMMMVSNSLYLPLPVILAVTPETLHDQAIVYVSIVSLPSMLFLWTAGVRLLSGPGSPGAGDRLRRLLNPPIVSILLGVLLSLIPGVRESARGESGGFAPLETLFSAMDHVGGLLSPLAMLLLGGMIASGGGEGRVPLGYLVPLAVVRLVLVPAGVYLLVRFGLRDLPAPAVPLLILVAASPPATNHALIARRYDGEWELVSRLQLPLHLFALVTLPLWLTAGLALAGA